MSKIRKRRRTKKQHNDATNLKNNKSNYKSFINSTKGFEKLHWGKVYFQIIEIYLVQAFRNDELTVRK